MIAGLRQLDRLVLALNDYLSRSNEPDAMPVFVLGARDQKLLHRRPLPKLMFKGDLNEFAAAVGDADGQVLFFNTHLVVGRSGFSQILDHPGAAHPPVLFVSSVDFPRASELNLQVAKAETDSPEWFYLHTAGEIGAAEQRLLSSTAKSQDGVIARYLNRPLSRVVSTWLLRLPISPNQWTLALMAAPVAGSILLMRGDYLGAAWGAILFQLQSALDGCDGEIARAKYLESEWGHKLDGSCDRLATMLLAIGLGIGLSRHAGLADGASSFYFLEGVLSALLIGVCETLLQRVSIEESFAREQPDNPSRSYVRSNQQFFNAGDHLKVWAIRHTGMLFLGERLTSFFVQLTKRDVFNFAFALFILCGRSTWVLHILAAVACGISLLALKTLLTMALARPRRTH